MSQNIVLKRSSLPGKVPDTGSLNLGEIAINTYDGKVFLKRSGSIESIQEIITTNVINTGSITLTQTGSFGELVTITDANIGHDLYISNDIIGNGDLDILGYITASLQTGHLIVGNAAGRTISVPTSSITTNINVSTLATTGSNTFIGNQTITGNVTATSFIGDGSGLTNLNVDDGLPNNNWDFNIEDTTPINDFQTASIVYLIDFNNLPLVGSEAGKIGWFGNTTGATQLLPTTNGLYIIAGDTQVGYVTAEGYSGSIVGIGNVTEFSSSVNNRINSLGGASGVVSGSSQLTSSYDLRYALSASYLTSLNGAISSSSQLTSSFEVVGRGIVSGAVQLPTLATTGSNTFTGLQTFQQIQEVISLKPSLGLGTNNFDFNSGSIFYIAGLTGSGTWNVQNIPSASNAATSLTFVVQQGATAYSASAYQLGGTAISVKWLDGTIPTGSANSTDVIGLTALRSGSSWNVIGSLSKFS